MIEHADLNNNSNEAFSNEDQNEILDNIPTFFQKFFDGASFIVDAILSTKKFFILRKLERIAKSVMNLKAKISLLTDEEIKAKTVEFQERLKTETLDDIMVEAFAVAREAAKRVLGEEHYKVQIMGGAAIHMGMIAEMKTGEGKTLVAILPTYLNALNGKGVHVLTVNDYLAKRDAEWMGRIHEFLGLTVGCVVANISQSSRKKQYNCDVVYITANQLGFDYLRDQLAKNESDICQVKGLSYCIVDEADSILIDEARVPLVSSGNSDEDLIQTFEIYKVTDKIVKSLEPMHYTINLKERKALFTDDGVDKVEELARNFGLIGSDQLLYTAKNSVILHHLVQCLRANHLYRAGVEYIVDKRNAEIKIVDEYTGRLLEGRRYSDGLHQALEAKEGLNIKEETETQATITFQKLFRLYSKLSGMTGTIVTEEEEIEQTYKTSCIPIPTNIKSKRLDHQASLYGSIEDKFEAIAELVKSCYEKGQPVLIGTVNVESSDQIGHYLKAKGLPIRILNAKNHEEEAKIIASAGRYGVITVVTNMAGRGVDIKLGGDPKFLIQERIGSVSILSDEQQRLIKDEILSDIKLNRAKVIKSGGLFVVGVEHNNNRRVDNQLRGRSGRQGDIGESKFFAALQDELPKKFLPNIVSNIFEKGEGIHFSSTLLTYWQTLEEGNNFDSRQHMKKYADIKEFYMEIFYNERGNVLYKTPLMNWLNDFITNFSQYKSKEILSIIGDKTKKNKTEHIRDLFFTKINAIFDTYKDYAEPYLRNLILDELDKMWRKYLTRMEHERSAVLLHQYAQKDPVIIFQNIAEKQFIKLINQAHLNIVSHILEIKSSNTNQEVNSNFEKPLQEIFNQQNPESNNKNMQEKIDYIFAKHNIDPMKIFQNPDAEYLDKFKLVEDEIKQNPEIKELNKKLIEEMNAEINAPTLKDFQEKMFREPMSDEIKEEIKKFNEKITQDDEMKKTLETIKESDWFKKANEGDLDPASIADKIKDIDIGQITKDIEKIQEIFKDLPQSKELNNKIKDLMKKTRSDKK